MQDKGRQVQLGMVRETIQGEGSLNWHSKDTEERPCLREEWPKEKGRVRAQCIEGEVCREGASSQWGAK